MQSVALVYPMFALVVWSFVTVMRLFFVRLKSVRAGEASVRYYQTYQVGEEPGEAAQLSRHFSNLFEAPVLFYAGCLAAISLGQTTQLLAILAWVYVGLRLVHGLIHTGPNLLQARIAAYFASWAALLAFWCVLVFGLG